MLRWSWCLLVLVGCQPVSDQAPQPMSTQEALALARPAADFRLAYGPEALHFGELRLPDGEGPFPLVIVIHGGCWLAEYDLGYISGLASRLTQHGYATWSIEYRRVGDDGGGWPGTFSDVAAAADFLRKVAEDHSLDLERVVALGHSAGGHLALWLAGRHRLPSDDVFRGEQPLDIRGVVALAGIPDLAAYASPEGCGAAVPGLIGGEPDRLSERLERCSPSAMLPLGTPQILVAGRLDPIVPLEHAERYLEAAVAAGDEASVRIVEHAGHFELVDPDDQAFRVVLSAVNNLISGSTD